MNETPKAYAVRRKFNGEISEKLFGTYEDAEEFRKLCETHDIYCSLPYPKYEI